MSEIYHLYIHLAEGNILHFFATRTFKASEASRSLRLSRSAQTPSFSLGFSLLIDVAGVVDNCVYTICVLESHNDIWLKIGLFCDTNDTAKSTYKVASGLHVNLSEVREHP